MKNKQEMIDELITIGFSIDNQIGSIAKYLVLQENFQVWTGSQEPNKHHYGEGGLLRHTYEVVTLCRKNSEIIFSLNNSEMCEVTLFLAALYHDSGKLWDYKPLYSDDGHASCFGYKNKYQVWTGTAHKRNIHHISRSALFFNDVANKFNIHSSLIDKIIHCILSHHGQRSWGSPVAPNSKEAYLLHLCDMISARTDDCEKIDLVHVNQS